MDVEHPPPGRHAPTFAETVGSDQARGGLVPFILVVVLAGIVLGTFQVANTSVGWHVASGRWMLEHHSFMRFDPFSFTSNQASWIDHEWLFQLVAAAVHAMGGIPALVILRALAVAALAVLLLLVGVRSGLSPPVAMLLSLLCVVGARPRFFVRPELATLLVVPGAVWLFLTRHQRQSRKWLIWLALIMVAGANSHGGALVIPILLGGMLAAETAEMMLRRKLKTSDLSSGIAAVVVATLALLVNPYGWKLFEVPFRLMELVDQPHIPNPEWVSPNFSQTPALFIAVATAVVLLAARERGAARWALLLMASYLAFRHIRNLGLFFVLLPLVVAKALSSWQVIAHRGLNDPRQRKLLSAAAVLGSVLVMSAALVAPWPRFGLTVADGYYPTAACDFLDRHELPQSELYNDVRFGGFLIERYAPRRLVFQDDRNEIHESLLLEIWNILRTSDVRGWEGLLERHGCDTALVRYHPSIQTAPSDGQGVATRGFSALWFPRKLWALVYWDDVAMVFVRRRAAHPEFLGEFEYQVVRPDDLDHLRWQVSRDPGLRQRALGEARRAEAAATDNRRAAALAAYLSRSPTAPLTGP